MVENAKHPIRIDLNEFKLHIDLRNKLALTLHFNSPSRRFYLSLIAFVVNEMKKRGKIIPIPLEEHLDLLALLNESIGDSAGSSERENLLPRIYRKWQHALPNLEEAPLFKVIGRKKEYAEGISKTYPFTEDEKDCWANLFEYKGSEENVRLKFAIDKMGATLDDVVIVYEDFSNGTAWERFVSSLKERVEGKPDNFVKSQTVTPVKTEVQNYLNSSKSRLPGDDDDKPKQAFSDSIKPETKDIDGVHKEPVAQVSPPKGRRVAWSSRYRWSALIVAIGVVVGTATLAIWKVYLKPASVKRASMERMAFPLPDVPSIAVLPFVNMSGDPKQEFLCDGMTEEIITSLSKVPRMFVIARNSTFTYKGKPVKVKQVSEELGVQYVLEGSIQRSGDRIRINAQLIDAITGHHLWTERYDRDMKDIFALQDEIIIKILNGVQVKLAGGDVSRSEKYAEKYFKGKQGLDCYLKLIQAIGYFSLITIEDNNLARRMIEEVIAMCPENPSSYIILGWVCYSDFMLGNTKSPRETIEKGIELAQKALAMDDSMAGDTHGLLSRLYSCKGEHDKAIAEGEQAVALNPSKWSFLTNYGNSLTYAGRPEEAIPLLQKVIRLNPFGPAFIYSNLGMALGMAGRFEESVSASKKAIQRAPNDIWAHLTLVVPYSMMGREKEARAEAAEVLRIYPKFSVDSYAKNSPFKDQSETDKVVNAWRKAGLK